MEPTNKLTRRDALWMLGGLSLGVVAAGCVTRRGGRSTHPHGGPPGQTGRHPGRGGGGGQGRGGGQGGGGGQGRGGGQGGGQGRGQGRGGGRPR